MLRTKSNLNLPSLQVSHFLLLIVTAYSEVDGKVCNFVKSSDTTVNLYFYFRSQLTFVKNIRLK